MPQAAARACRCGRSPRSQPGPAARVRASFSRADHQAAYGRRAPSANDAPACPAQRGARGLRGARRARVEDAAAGGARRRRPVEPGRRCARPRRCAARGRADRSGREDVHLCQGVPRPRRQRSPRGGRGRRRSGHDDAASAGATPRDPAKPTLERRFRRRPARSRYVDALAALVAFARRRRRRRSRGGRSLCRRQRTRPLAHPPHRRPLWRRTGVGCAALWRHARHSYVSRGARMIRVLIVDDHELLRAGLRSRLEREDGISVVGEADSAERAVIVARAVQPDLILLDLLLPRKNGYDVIPELADVAPQAKVLVVSSQAAPSSVRRALSAGAAGYLPKRSSDRELVAAIRLVAGGGGYVEPDLGAKLVSPNGSPALEPLSERERDILHVLALGYTNQEIAKKLFISVRTVDTHRAHIMRKLQLETRAELVMFALANGVIGPNAG